MTVKQLLIGLVIFGGLGFGGWQAWNSAPVQDWLDDRTASQLPVAEQLAESIAAPAINAVVDRYGQAAVENAGPVPSEKNLAVPFTSQAPHANWDLDHNEFCEEASVLMVGRYFQRRAIAGADDAEAALQEIKAWELDQLGFYYDTTAAETARILEGLYGLRVELVTDPTVERIKRAIASGQLVIAPFAGQDLGNPNYTPPGPPYHMLVIRGYTDDGKFITNDPGTRRGEEYVYNQSTIMNAMHDWVPDEPRTEARNGSATGRQVILVIGR